MPKVPFLQLAATTDAPLRRILHDVRHAVSGACSGIDDMHLLGAKALVLRAEIRPPRLPELVRALDALGVRVDRESLPAPGALDDDALHPLTVQVTSFNDDTDGPVDVPHVPG
jgi:hypothetical protein